MTEPPKGGKLSRQAAMLCQDANFCLYLDRRRRHKHGMTEDQLPDRTHDQDDARDWLCQACNIASRAELDHEPYAAETFKGIRARYQRWRSKQLQQH